MILIWSMILAALAIGEWFQYLGSDIFAYHRSIVFDPGSGMETIEFDGVRWGRLFFAIAAPSVVLAAASWLVGWSLKSHRVNVAAVSEKHDLPTAHPWILETLRWTRGLLILVAWLISWTVVSGLSQLSGADGIDLPAKYRDKVAAIILVKAVAAVVMFLLAKLIQYSRRRLGATDCSASWWNPR